VFRRWRRSPDGFACSCSTGVSGEPVYGMEERPVPQNGVSGRGHGEDAAVSREAAAAREEHVPARRAVRPVRRSTRASCRELFESNRMKIGGPYTPLPLEGTRCSSPAHSGAGTGWAGCR